MVLAGVLKVLRESDIMLNMKKLILCLLMALGYAQAVNWGDLRAADVCFINRVDLRILNSNGGVDEIISTENPKSFDYQQIGFKEVEKFSENCKYTIVESMENYNISPNSPILGELFISLSKTKTGDPIIWTGYKIGAFYDFKNKNELMDVIKKHSIIMSEVFIKDWESSHR